MTRKTTALLIVLLLVSGMAWSQVIGLRSFQSGVSQGLLPNALDAAFSVNGFDPVVSFNKLVHTYLFAGLANFHNFLATTASTSVQPTIGFYRNGSMPWSVFVNPSIASASAGATNGTTPTPGVAVTVTSGTTDTTYNWNMRETTREYVFFDDVDIDLPAQFLIGLGTINAGLFVRYTHDQNVDGLATNTWADNNRTQVESNYINSAPAGTAPVQALDYTVTTIEEDPDTQSNWTFQVPLYVGIGSVGIEAAVGVELETRDQSESTTVEMTASQTPRNPPQTTDLDSTADKTRSLDLSAAATLSLPVLAAAHPRNRLDVGLGAGLTFNSAEDLVVRTRLSDYDFPGTGQAAIITDRTDIDTTTVRQGSTAFDASVGAQQLVYFDIADMGAFAIGPTARVTILRIPTDDLPETNVVEVVRVDNNDDGAYTDASDTIETTTTVRTYAAQGAFFLVAPAVELPAAITFRPAGWPFGVTLGSTLSASATILTTTGDALSTTVTTAMVTGTGAAVGNTTVNQGVSSVASKSTHTSWSFQATQSLGVNIFLPNDITLDVLLKLASLLHFDSLTIQAIIPLK